MWSFHRVELTDDIFDKCWQWYLQMPSFLRQFDREEKNDFQIQDYTFGAFVDGELVAVVEAHGIQPGVMNGHLFCQPNIGIDVLVALITYSTDWLFTHTATKTVFNIVHKKHKTLKTIMFRAGFAPTGYSVWLGTDVKNRLYDSEMFFRSK